MPRRLRGRRRPAARHDARHHERSIASLYAIDRSLPHRKSHENPVILKLYERDLGAPLSPKAHDLLHTTYHEIPPACTF